MVAASLTRDDVVDVALSILDSGGLPALAMRRIATQLGVQQSALYWHFANKQELLAGVADRILDAVPPVGSGSWQERVVERATGLRTELLNHQDGAELVATAFAFQLEAKGPFRGFVDELTTAGLDADEADIAGAVFLHFVLGHVTSQQQHAQAARLGAISDTRHSDNSDDKLATERFARGLSLIVSGVRARADPR